VTECDQIGGCTLANFAPTPEQQEILDHDPGRHGRLLAGPGTGKSATLVAYVDQLLSVEPRPRLRLLTFTRAATGELARKVSEHPATATLRPSTIHSFAISVLLQNRGAGGILEPLRIADDWESANIVRPKLARIVGVTVTRVKTLINEMAAGWESLEPEQDARVDAATRALFHGA
jgi:superfamily I DNA/RNA helicase